MEVEVSAYSRALFLALAARDVPPPAQQASFHWVLRPPGGTVCAKFYTDGSRLDGPSALLARHGWSFVAMDRGGAVVAVARGVPPPWVDDIPGAEAWAVLQAAYVAELGSQFRIDCEPCVKAIHRGRAWATSAERPHARLYGLLFSAIDDTPVEAFVWMPSHTGLADVGRLLLGDGSTLTADDRRGNERADTEAKEAVAEYRVPLAVRARVASEAHTVHGAACWLRRVTHLANHQPTAPQRDSQGGRRRGQRPRQAAQLGGAPRADVVEGVDRAYLDAVAVGRSRWVSLVARVRAREAAAVTVSG